MESTKRNGYLSGAEAVLAAVLQFLRPPKGGGSLEGFDGIILPTRIAAEEQDDARRIARRSEPGCTRF